jgi:hypothetical protein
LYAAFHGGDGSVVAHGVNQATGADLRIFLILAAYLLLRRFTLLRRDHAG